MFSLLFVDSNLYVPYSFSIFTMAKSKYIDVSGVGGKAGGGDESVGDGYGVRGLLS